MSKKENDQKENDRYENGPQIKVIVTQEIIDNAIESNSAHCVVADAIKASLLTRGNGRYKGVSVDLGQIRITDKKLNKRFVWFTPHLCQRAITQFDQGKRKWLQPFHFWLRYPIQVLAARSRTGLEPSPQHSAAGKKGGKVTGQRRASLAVKADGRGSWPRSTKTQKKGGKQIPTGALMGNRRQFGVKALGNLDAPTAG